MLRNFAAVAVGAAGIYALVNATSLESGLVGCDMDGDGQFYTEAGNGELKKANGWSLSEDGKTCTAGGGTWLETLPRKDLVDNFGNALMGDIGRYLQHYSEELHKQGGQISLHIK